MLGLGVGFIKLWRSEVNWLDYATITEIRRGSLADKNGIRVGDLMVSVNGRLIRDILDYELGIADEQLDLEIIRNGDRHHVEIDNPNYENLGIYFSTSVFDGIKTCANKCVFCFIDQLPPGMRESVYVKDDDYRLSFLYGNFITLTNMQDKDIDRIIKDRISPLYVSLHATNQELRTMMLGRKKTDRSLYYLKRLSEAGIELHIQIVVCPGLNDKDELDRSIGDLSDKYSNVASVGIVPVGLTGYREGLYDLRPFDKRGVKDLVSQVNQWQDRFEKEKGYAWVYIADEFYISAGYELPSKEHYGEFPQIENGIGLSRLFVDEVGDNIKNLRRTSGEAKISVVTGLLFESILKDVVSDLIDAFEVEIDVIAVKNDYFGGEVNVTGLLTGSDIVKGVNRRFLNKGKADLLILPDIILNGDGLTLDGYTVQMIAEQVDVKVAVSDSSGTGLIECLMEV